MAKRVFMVHGWEGSPKSNWLPWLKKMLEDRGIQASVPQFPDPINPKQGPWLNTINEIVGEPDEDSYLIGHSLGCITILRYLESLKRDEKMGGAILVAGFTEDLGIKELGDFFTSPIDWSKITRHCNKFVVIASDNDPYVPLKYSNILKDGLNARVLIQPKMGHFQMQELHVVLNELLKMVNSQ